MCPRGMIDITPVQMNIRNYIFDFAKNATKQGEQFK